MAKLKGELLWVQQVGNNMEVIKEVKLHISSKFDMKDLDVANLILGMEVKRHRVDRKLWLNQKKYILRPYCIGLICRNVNQ